MEIIALYRNERAVSPAIGVVLLVAIAVMAMAIVGILVLGSSFASDKPKAKFDFETHSSKNIAGPDEILITHAYGASLPHDRLYITATTKIRDESGSTPLKYKVTWGEIEGADGFDQGNEADGTADPGDVAAIEPANGEEMDGETIRVVYDTGAGSQVQLAEFTVPKQRS